MVNHVQVLVYILYVLKWLKWWNILLFLGGEEAGKAVSGTVSFECTSEACTINYRVEGLTPGLHGFHM